MNCEKKRCKALILFIKIASHLSIVSCHSGLICICINTLLYVSNLFESSCSGFAENDKTSFFFFFAVEFGCYFLKIKPL